MIEPFVTEHLATLVPGKWDRANFDILSGDPGRWEGVAVSLRRDGRTLAVVGILGRGDTAHVWAVASDDARRNPMVLGRMARASLPLIAALPGVRRVCAEAEDGPPARLVEWLGFVRIGAREYAYGP